MRYRNDPFGTRLPIKLDTTTNGEFAPIPSIRCTITRVISRTMRPRSTRSVSV